jgi:hypothetical protein
MIANFLAVHGADWLNPLGRLNPNLPARRVPLLVILRIMENNGKREKK